MYKIFELWRQKFTGIPNLKGRTLAKRTEMVLSVFKSELPISGKVLFLSAISLVLSLVLQYLFPIIQTAFLCSYITMVVSSLLFVRSERKQMRERAENGCFDKRAVELQDFFTEQGIQSEIQFQRLLVAADYKIEQGQKRQNDLKDACSLVMTFVTGFLSGMLLQYDRKLSLPLLIVISLVLFGLAISNVPDALFSIVDRYTLTPHRLLMQFKEDILDTQLHVALQANNPDYHLGADATD